MARVIQPRSKRKCITVASQLLDPDPFSSPYSGLRISSFFDFGNVGEADFWPLLTFAYDLPRNGLLGVCSSDREADEWIRLNLYMNYSMMTSEVPQKMILL